jgi:23S rRNA (uracil747-C5)-methyltransferase
MQYKVFLMYCDYFSSQKCLSCNWLNKPYSQQLMDKQQTFSQLLQPFQPIAILSPIASHEVDFRNKAKMAVLGTVEKPILGILNHNQQPIDLSHCPLYPTQLQQALTKLKQFISSIGLVPYNIKKRRGELKFIILTLHDNQLMLRFVLRSKAMIDRLRVSLNKLYASLPNLAIISVNIQPLHAAILEGEEEIVLSDSDVLAVNLNHVPLFIRPQSFFQTNTEIARQLYQTAADWVNQLTKDKKKAINHIWDLFCGVGGFGLHCTNHSIRLTGIEINKQAIACAKQSADLMQLPKLDFRAYDSTQFALAQADIPDLVLVNPPRRGLGKCLANYLHTLKPHYILYSSCNLSTQLSDLALLPNYQIVKAQLFDMFPHTAHMETMLLLQHIEN